MLWKGKLLCLSITTARNLALRLRIKLYCLRPRAFILTTICFRVGNEASAALQVTQVMVNYDLPPHFPVHLEETVARGVESADDLESPDPPPGSTLM
jgi:hypothetical protein